MQGLPIVKEYRGTVKSLAAQRQRPVYHLPHKARSGRGEVMSSWAVINKSRPRGEDAEDDERGETNEEREARQSATYREALMLHGQGKPHSEEWGRAKTLYNTVIADKPTAKSSSAFDAPVRFLCLKNLADMVEREGDDDGALELIVTAADEDETDLGVWLKMARLARKLDLLNVARFALERLLDGRQDHILALKMLRNLLLDIGDGAAVREVTERLVRLDPYIGASLPVGKTRARSLTRADPSSAALDLDALSSLETEVPKTSGICVERTLELPTWARVGKVLLDIRITGGDHVAESGSRFASEAPIEGQTDAAAVAASRSRSSEGRVPSGGRSLKRSAQASVHMLSTPVRIIVPEPDQSTFADDALEVEGAEVVAASTAADGSGGDRLEARRQQYLRTRPRRPSVEKAMEFYSDGSSSSEDEDDEDGKSLAGKRGRGRWGNSSGGADRRTSGRLQRQDEMREADVAAAKEHDLQHRVAALFVSAKELDNGRGSSGASPQKKPETSAWWPQLPAGAHEGGGMGPETDPATLDTNTDEDGAALASKMLPKWTQRHDEDCHRCGAGGILCCCDFCHLVYHTKCLDVAPSLSGLFACPECQEEAATREWEMKGREAATGALDTGLRTLLAAAAVDDGGSGNAGVVDLMLRWLTGVATARPEDLHRECQSGARGGVFKSRGGCAYGAGQNNAARGRGGFGAGSGAGAMTTVWPVAEVALAMETFVRGYLPVRASWSALSSRMHLGGTPGAGADVYEGPELGIPCELMLAEMHLDRALALTGRPRAIVRRGLVASVSGPDKQAAASSNALVVANAGGDDGPKGSGVPATDPDSAGRVNQNGGARGTVQGGEDKAPADALLSEARTHFAAADVAMLHLEPYLLCMDTAAASNEGDESGDRGKCSSPGESNIEPWALAARWWWLKGSRARSLGHAEDTLDALRRCERVLMEREERCRKRRAQGANEDGAEAYVALPYCVVHQMVDLKVVRGVVADVELSGTSEAAREAFSRAIHLLAQRAKASSKASSAVASPAALEASTAVDVEAAMDLTGASVQPASQQRLSYDATSAREDRGGNGDRRKGDEHVESGRSPAVESSARPATTAEATATASKGGASPRGPPNAPPRTTEGATAIAAHGLGEARQEALMQPSVISKDPTGDHNIGPPAKPTNEAITALTAVMRGLESRFVQRSPSGSVSPTAILLQGQSLLRAPGARSDDDECGAESLAATPDTPASRLKTAGWSIRIRSARAEELLVDLLEREKGSFAQINRDGARAIERWTSAGGDSPFTCAPYFIAPSMTAGSPVGPSPGYATTCADYLSSAAGDLASIGVAGALQRRRQELLRQQRSHFDVELSAQALGGKASIFSMMLRSASILNEHETAVLVAARCSQHFLDACDLLQGLNASSSDCPSSAGSGDGSRAAAESLGAVSLLLASRGARGDRRSMDAVVTSCCAEFLARALAIALWAIPYTTRRRLFFGQGDHTNSVSSSARRTAVTKCLSRFLRQSLDHDNTRVLNLVACAWQAIAAVAVPTPGSLEPEPSTSEQSKAGPSTSLPIPDLRPGEISGNSAGTQTPETIGNDAASGVDRDANPEDAECSATDSRGRSGSPYDVISREQGKDGSIEHEEEQSDVVADPLQALLRSLCAVLVGRWKQASSSGKSPKRAWVLHTMEALHALIRTLEYRALLSGHVLVVPGLNCTFADSEASDDARSGRGNAPAGTGRAVVDADKGCDLGDSGTDAGRKMLGHKRCNFVSALEMKEIVDALMGLSQLPDGNMAASATGGPGSPKAAPAGTGTTGGGGAAGAAGAGGSGAPGSTTSEAGSSGSSGGGLGLKLACTMALLTLGLSDVSASMNTRRRIELIDALHDHLKGKAAPAPVNLGAVPESLEGKGGVCADAEGVFLRTALLYLSSPEVSCAVDREEAKARLAQETGSNGSAGGLDSDELRPESSGVAIESGRVGGGGVSMDGPTGEDKRADDNGNHVDHAPDASPEKTSPQSEDEGSITGGGPNTAADITDGERNREPTEARLQTLRELVNCAVAQGQACLYDVAMIPCADHRCATPPRAPPTALEAHHLYTWWDRRLPAVRRSQALRLLEGVVSHENFASPPPTRFSSAVHDYLYSGWSILRKGQREDRSRGSASPARALPPSTTLMDVLGFLRHPAREPDGEGGRKEHWKGSVLRSDGPQASVNSLAPDNTRNERRFVVESRQSTNVPGVSPALASEGMHVATGLAQTQTPECALRVDVTPASTSAASGARDRDGARGRASDAVGGEEMMEQTARYKLPPEMQPFARLYSGLYRNLAEAKGVPWGSKSRTFKSGDGASATETLLLEGIRWRILDLGVCPSRVSSWKGLAQCCSRLAAIYLDAFPPSCHRLAIPLTDAGVISAPEARTLTGPEAAAAGPEGTNASEMDADGGGSTAPVNLAGGATADEPLVIADDDSSSGSASFAGHGEGSEKARALSTMDVDNFGGAAADERVNMYEKPPRGTFVRADGGRDGSVSDSASSIELQSPEQSRSPSKQESSGAQMKSREGDSEHHGRKRDQADAAIPAAEVAGAAGNMLVRNVRENDAHRLASTDTVAASDLPGEGRPLSVSASALAGSARDGDERRTEGGLTGNAGGTEISEGSEWAMHGRSVLGLRGIPCPHVGVFFQGSALDAKAARKDTGRGDSAEAGTSEVKGMSSENVSRVTAVSMGLRFMKARTTAERKALEGMAARVLDGTATHEEWSACSGHASITAAVALAERAFAAWKALAEETLSHRRREVLRVEGGKAAHTTEDGPRHPCEDAARELAECCEEEAYMKYMLARDVWIGFEDETTERRRHVAAPTTPAGLEPRGPRRLMESALALLKRAHHLRETGGSPGSPSPHVSRRRRRSNTSPLPKELSGSRGSSGAGLSAEPEKSPKRRKLSPSGSGAGSPSRAGTPVAMGTETDSDGSSDDDEAEERWQAPFVMGRLYTRLGTNSRAALENLSQALHLAKAEDVPLEDELEALCRLHCARAELIMAGDLDNYAPRAALVEEFAYRGDGESADGGPGAEAFPVGDAQQPPRRDSKGSGAAATGLGAGLRHRRLAALENCLDAYESCLKKNRGQYTAIFAAANALYRGAHITDAARTSSDGRDTTSAAGSKNKRSFGPQAALTALKPLFEKRQQLLQAMSGSDGVVGPGLALLGTRRRKLHALRRKYVGLYVELLEVSKNTATLQGLVRRGRTSRETRDEMLWVQATVTRALLGTLRSELAHLLQKRPASPSSAATVRRTSITGAAAVGTGARTEAMTSSASGAVSAAVRATLTGSDGARGGAKTGEEQGDDRDNKFAEAGGDEDQAEGAKQALERAWDLYLQVLDLESLARAGGSGLGAIKARESSSAITLLVDAEEVLVQAWEAFGKANPALLELVELQNPVSPSKPGSGTVEAGKSTLRRIRACCNAIWPDKQGKGKVSKSKLKLKRPAPHPSFAAAFASRARPKAARSSSPSQDAWAMHMGGSVPDADAPLACFLPRAPTGAGSRT